MSKSSTPRQKPKTGEAALIVSGNGDLKRKSKKEELNPFCSAELQDVLKTKSKSRSKRANDAEKSKRSSKRPRETSSSEEDGEDDTMEPDSNLQNGSGAAAQYILRKRNTPSHDEIPVCDCHPVSSGLGCLSSCVNRHTHIECSKSFCPNGDRCANMRFQKRQYPKLKVVPAEGKGFGVITLEDIAPGQFVIEYVGEVISIDDCAERMKDARHFYFLTIDSNEGIDASRKGNIARFINHSCQPNCETQKWWVNGETSVGIFAKEMISKGTELTFDYKFERLGVAKQKCLCGSVICRGYLGAAPVKNELEEVRHIFANHQRHVERLLKDVDPYEIDDLISDQPDWDDTPKNRVPGSSAPVFRKGNLLTQRLLLWKEYHRLLNMMYKEREHTLSERIEKRRQSVARSRSYMMGLNIDELIRQGLVVFETDETMRKRNPRRGEGEVSTSLGPSPKKKFRPNNKKSNAAPTDTPQTDPQAPQLDSPAVSPSKLDSCVKAHGASPASSSLPVSPSTEHDTPHASEPLAECGRPDMMVVDS